MGIKVSFNRDGCKGCRLCTVVCPKKIVTIEESATNNKGFHPATIKPKDEPKCIGCACCARICPDSIITIERF